MRDYFGRVMDRLVELTESDKLVHRLYECDNGI